MKNVDEKWMRVALEEAELALREQEVPVGAVIVKDGVEIARAHNRCENDCDATAHAERLAVSAACKRLGGKHLTGCTLYVTLEPCPMCMGAAISARVDRVVFAAKDARAGACESLLRLADYPLESRPQCVSGVLQEQSLALLREFFIKLRNQK